MRIFHKGLLVVAGATVVAHLGLAEEDTKFTNQGGVSNTRHNMTQRPPGGTISANMMDNYRNNYGEVCVYCHTPHAANASAPMPLWNRQSKATTYTTYDQLNTSTLTQTVYQPGAASLMCLSCHDGQQAIDAVLNMPGSGKYSATPDSAFLNTWTNPAGGLNAKTHFKLNAVPSGTINSASCLVCHTPAIYDEEGSIGLSGYGGAQDFTAAALGKDLRDDHPVGVIFPATTGDNTDWKTPNGSRVGGAMGLTFFDENSNSRPDKNEIRMYDSGGGPRVECGSCHDPHGVPSAGPDSSFNPTFLRKTNQNSLVCLTCHSK